MKKRICLLLALLMLLPAIAACSNSDAGGNTDAATEGTIGGEPIFSCIPVADGTSDYTIVVDTSDVAAKQFAYFLQEAIESVTGVLLPVRGLSGMEQYSHRILIGDTGDAITDTMKDGTLSNCFSVRVDGSKLAMFASDVNGYLQMEQYTEKVLLVGGTAERWELEDNMAYVSAPSDAAVPLIENGSSNYSLVYDSSNADARVLANRIAVYLEEICGVRFHVAADSRKTACEILIGGCDRSEAQAVSKYLSGNGAYALLCSGSKLVLAAKDEIGLVACVGMLANALEQAVDGRFVFTTQHHHVGAVQIDQKTEELKQAAEVYRKLYNTFGSWAEEKMSHAPTADQADQRLVEALTQRLEGGFAVLSGSSSVLYQGYKSKLDPTDYCKITKVENGHVLVPSVFLRSYFQDQDLPTDMNGYTDLTALCQNLSDYRLALFEAHGLAVLLPVEKPAFEALREKVDGFTNLEYINRMMLFFESTILPEPQNHIEQTRQEIAAAPFVSDYIFDYTRETYETYFSPGICVVGETDGSRTIYVSHEVNLLCDFKTETTSTVLKKSTDGGRTWTKVAEFYMLQWASIIELEGKVWLIGYSHSKSTVKVACYDPVSGTSQSKDLSIRVGGSAPCTVAVQNGRLYKAFNNGVISIDLSQNLMNSENWRVSNDPNQLFTKELYLNATGAASISEGREFRVEEGNVIIGKDGLLYAIYRIDAYPNYGYAAIFLLSEDGTTVSLVSSCNSVIAIPSSESKFSVRYDEQMGLYISFFSYPTMEYADQRNVLVMACSEDLLQWEVLDVILVDRQLMNEKLSCYAHAFQYVDFVFAGKDILFIVREATGETNTYHDGTYVTLYTISDYVDFINHCRSNG